jgi:hypothetical protein
MTATLAITFTLFVIYPLTWRIVRHVVLVGRLRRMCAVRSEPRPWVYGSKA